MIDQWFKKDLQDIYAGHSVAVFIDESGDAEFLLKTVRDDYTIHQANSELDELYVKYLIEKAHPGPEKFLVYTRTKKDKLKFIREYCETCGYLEIRHLQNYIKEKVHHVLKLNINLPKEELMAAAKVSVGKDKTYWRDLCHKGGSAIFNLNIELIPFIHDPDTYANENNDTQLRETFYRKVNEMLGQDYLAKPAKTLAHEVVKTMLDGLAHGTGNKTLESVYSDWLDSVTYRDSFNEYLGQYTLRTDLDIWNVSINHPFCQVDEQWLAEIGQNLSNKPRISAILDKLRQRNQSKQAKSLGIRFWKNVIALLEFEPDDITRLSSFNECVAFYKKHFFTLDTAIRDLYAEFLNKTNLLEPFQELYKEYVTVFLDKWFSHWSGYQENQIGILQKIIDEAGGSKTAVIIGDGVSYEIAELIAAKVKSTANLKRGSILADIPSETENNMSRIYMDNGITEPIQRNREKYLLSKNPGLTIDFIRIDQVNKDTGHGQFLICSCKDIDDIGEKLQQNALKHFPEIIDFFGKTISLLLEIGYTSVYLISDHGFVLTGILSEADKISVSPVGDFSIAERYIRTAKKQTNLLPGLVEVERNYQQYNYLYFARNINPFKTPGKYGFSHGGISPQELITPCFCWEHSDSNTATLTVTIENKEDLKSVTGELFSIKIHADKDTGDLFSMKRDIYLMFFANTRQVKTSDVFTIKRNEIITREFLFDDQPVMEVHLLDAATKERLDKAVIKQNRDRDLGI
jgi:hypothetical protein